MSENLDVRARLTAVNEMSPILRQVLADLKKFESVAKRIGDQFSSIGRVGTSSMDAFNRAANAATSQMRGLANVSRQASRDYISEWKRAADQRLNESRRMYAQLERMESTYLRQIERRAAAERRAEQSAGRGVSGRLGSGSVGRIPAPRLSTVAVGGGLIGAGVGSALRKRMEIQAAEVRSSMYGELSASDILDLRKSFADRAGIRFGVGTSKALDVATEGLKAGIAKEFAGQFGELALKAQAGLDIPTEDVAKLMGRLSSQMAFNKDRYSQILNAVAVANNATAADGKEIVEAMRRSLSALATTRMTPEQLAAIDATGISLGIQPFKAGTFVSFLTSQIAGADSARGQQAGDLNSAANALGFGGRTSMAKAMRERPTETIQQILEGLAKLPERLRAKVAKQIGGREWMDELLTLVLGRDKLRDVLKDVESKPGFLDRTALQKIRSMQGRWASISAALGLVWEKVGAGLETWFDKVSESIIDLADSFNFDSIKEHFAALIDGAREGFGLKDWGEVVKAVADNFDAGTVAKWREFGKGFAEGLREFASGLKVAFSALGFLAGKNPTNARELGNLIAKLTGLTVALAVLSPLLSVLTTLAVGLIGLGNALAFIGGSAIALRALGLLARFSNPAVATALMGDGRPNNSAADMRSLQDAYREEREKNKALGLDRETRRKLRRLRDYKPSGDPMFQPTGFTGQTDFSGRRGDRIDDLAEQLNKFGANVQRAALISGGGLQYAAVSGAGLGLSGSGGGFGGHDFLGSAPGLLKVRPGTAIPNMGDGIIRRDRIPSFGGGGGSVAKPGAVPFTGGDTSMGAGLSGNAYLAARRAKFKRELEENPELKKRLAALIDLENPGAGTAVAESLMNRIDMNGGSIAGGIGGGSRSFYGPVRRGLVEPRVRELEHNPAKMAARMRQIDEALAGSNYIQGHTDQGSAGDPNYFAGGTGVNINRERFNDWGGGRWHGKTGHAASRAFREDLMRHVQGAIPAPVTSQVPASSDLIQNVPTSSGAVTNGLLGRNGSAVLQGVSAGGPVNIHINGNSHDPEALATLVQRRVDESMNWRTHDTASEYT